MLVLTLVEVSKWYATDPVVLVISHSLFQTKAAVVTFNLQPEGRGIQPTFMNIPFQTNNISAVGILLTTLILLYSKTSRKIFGQVRQVCLQSTNSIPQFPYAPQISINVFGFKGKVQSFNLLGINKGVMNLNPNHLIQGQASCSQPIVKQRKVATVYQSILQVLSIELPDRHSSITNFFFVLVQNRKMEEGSRLER